MGRPLGIREVRADVAEAIAAHDEWDIDSGVGDPTRRELISRPGPRAALAFGPGAADN